MVTAPIMKNDNWYIQSAIPVRNFVKFYKNSQQRLAWSGFFVQTFSVWIKFLDKKGFSGFENKWIFIFDMFNSKSLEVADCMSRQGKVLSRRFINFSSLGVEPKFTLCSFLVQGRQLDTGSCPSVEFSNCCIYGFILVNLM